MTDKLRKKKSIVSSAFTKSFINPMIKKKEGKLDKNRYEIDISKKDGCHLGCYDHDFLMSMWERSFIYKHRI